MPDQTVRRIDAADIIDRARVGSLQMRVFACCLAVSMLDGFDTQATSFVAAELLRRFHVAPAYFGWIFSAGLMGTAMGAVAFGALADRYGRRRVLSLTVGLFGLMTFACAFVQDSQTLLILRLLGGLGLGGAVPNFLTLASEYAPARSRATWVVMTLWGFPLGAALGGWLSVYLIARYGWPAVFFVGGLLPVLLVPLLWTLPESIRFLVARTQQWDRAIRVLQSIDPAVRATDVLVGSVAGPSAHWRQIFGRPWAYGTWLFGLALCLSLLLAYLLVAWIPLLLQELGLPLRDAALGAVVLNLSGIAGSFLLSRLIDYTGQPLRIMIGSYLAVAAAVLSFGVFGHSLVSLLMSIGLASFFLIGTQLSLTAHTAQMYPSALRASGAGFIQAFGRLGSIAGPLVGASLVGAGLGPLVVVRAGVIPALLVAAALFAAHSLAHKV